jgi:hypothetical protein
MSYSEALSLVRYQTRTAAAFSNLATPPIGDQFKPRGTLLTDGCGSGYPACK